MARHATLLIDDEVHRRVREHQARKTLERNKAYSYSAALNDLLARGVWRVLSMHPISGDDASGAAGGQGEVMLDEFRVALEYVLENQ